MNGADNVYQIIKSYYGNTAVIVLASLAVFIFWLRHKEKRQFLYLTALLFVVLLNDGVYAVMKKIGEETTYYRMLWILPVAVLAGTLIIWCAERVQGTGEKIAFVGCVTVACVMLSDVSLGDLFRLPENIYLMPQETIEICDIIDEYHPGGHERVLYAEESLTDGIREYDANIQVSIGGDTAFLETMVTYGMSDVSGVITKSMLSSAKINYVVIRKEFNALHYTMLSSGCSKIGSTEEYYVYAVDLDRLEKEFLEVGKYDSTISNLEDVEIEAVQETESYILHGDGHIDVVDAVSGEITSYLTEEKEYQIYDAGEYYICSIDNSDGNISEETLTSVLNLEKKPIILLLSLPLYQEGIATAKETTLFGENIGETDSVTEMFVEYLYRDTNVKAIFSGNMVNYSRKMINETTWQCVCMNEKNAVWLTIK